MRRRRWIGSTFAAVGWLLAASISKASQEIVRPDVETRPFTLTVELTPRDAGTCLTLTHTGFPDDETRKGHEAAWPNALDHLEAALTKP